MQGLYFLAGLIAILWLAWWIAQEGREKPEAKRRWSPFEWRDEGTQAAETTRSPRAGSWRDRPAASARSRSGERRR